MEKIKAFCVKYGALILIFLMCLMLRGCIDLYKGTQAKRDTTVVLSGDSLPDNGSFVVGVPGRVIKKRFDDETVDRLQKANWWDLPVEVIKKHIRLFRDGHLNKDTLSELERVCKEYGAYKE